MIESGSIMLCNTIRFATDSDYDDDDFYMDDIDLINDLYDATSSNADMEIQDSSLSVIHHDIQLLTMTVLLIYVVFFVIFLIRKWR